MLFYNTELHYLYERCYTNSIIIIIIIKVKNYVTRKFLNKKRIKKKKY